MKDRGAPLSNTYDEAKDVAAWNRKYAKKYGTNLRFRPGLIRNVPAILREKHN